jgi:hypothetical protein
MQPWSTFVFQNPPPARMGVGLISREANPRGKYSNEVAATIWRKIDIESKLSIILFQRLSLPKLIEAERNSVT